MSWDIMGKKMEFQKLLRTLSLNKSSENNEEPHKLRTDTIIRSLNI